MRLWMNYRGASGNYILSEERPPRVRVEFLTPWYETREQLIERVTRAIEEYHRLGGK